MGMTIKEIIDGLQFTIDMFLFNPSTGEIQPKHLLNEDSRLTVDACEGAIDTMRKYQKIEQIVSDFREYQKGISCGFGGATYMQMVSEVVEDGRN